MDTESETDNFIFVKSITAEDRSQKRPAWSRRPFERSGYLPSIDEERDWTSKDMKEQIVSTVSSLETKQLKDKEKVYVVLGVESQFVPNENSSKIRKQVFYPNTLRLLKGLSAEVLCYLNSEHTNFLISCRLSDLTHLLNRRKYRRRYFETVKRISPLLVGEQISENLKKDKEWATESKDVLIELIPNLSVDKKNEYAKIIVAHLKEVDKETDCCDEDFVLTKLNEESTKDLLKTSNFVFRVSEIPRGVLQRTDRTSKKGRARESQRVKGQASSTQSQKSQYGVLPIVCVLDSGVNARALLRIGKCQV